MQISGLAQDLLSLASGVGTQDLKGVLMSLAVRATSHREGGHGLPDLFPKHWTASSVPGPRTMQCPVPGRGCPIPPCPCLQLALGQVLPRTGLSHALSFLTLVMAPPEPREDTVQGHGPGNPTEAKPSGCCPAEQPGVAKDVQGSGPPCSETASLLPGATRHALASLGILGHMAPIRVPQLCGLPGRLPGWDVTRNG